MPLPEGNANSQVQHMIADGRKEAKTDSEQDSPPHNKKG